MSEITGGVVIREALRTKFGFLFVSLVLTLALPPLLPDGPLISFLFSGLVTAVLLSGLYAVSIHRRTFLAGLFVVIPAVPMMWVARATGSTPLQLVGEAFVAAFMIFLAWNILLHILRAQRVNADLVFAAICIYMLIGFGCAFGYSIMELSGGQVLSLPDVFESPRREGLTLYYSFVTLTTLGYGDITPVSDGAKVLAVLEAITGQLILVVLVARLVGLQIAHEKAAA